MDVDMDEATGEWDYKWMAHLWSSKTEVEKEKVEETEESLTPAFEEGSTGALFAGSGSLLWLLFFFGLSVCLARGESETEWSGPPIYPCNKV